ncbi:alpha/beta hydrolase [Diaminobutyricimonas sp. LJ205]|uniref:alpha/beta hydrolase n=1 Tax=Diaminobutyricimonas sp. LJ205 TaxID=2683590 RepID=UPI0012F48FA1|nr:alpha/beta hydrolase [Diaminobutyricimonas sp. LJ205]
MIAPPLAGDPGVGSVEAIRSAQESHSARAVALRLRADEVRGAVADLGSQQGVAVDALRARLLASAQRFTDLSAVCDQTSGILRGYADGVESIQLRARDLRDQAQASDRSIARLRDVALSNVVEDFFGLFLSWDSVLPAWMHEGDDRALVRWQSAINTYELLQQRWAGLLQERDLLDAETASRLAASDVFDAVTAAELGELPSATQVRSVWNALSKEQRADLIAGQPAIIGNLDGIPLADRAAANRLNIQAEIDRLEAEVDAEAGRANPRYRRQWLIDELKSTIGYYEQLLHAPTRYLGEDGMKQSRTGSMVVIFDPTRAGIATYQGPLDAATGEIPTWIKSVGIYVPGTGTQMETFGGAEDRLNDLYDGSAPTTALFAWAGGRFPQGLEAITASFSEDLGPSLAGFVGGLSVPAEADLTVFGHSYGAAVVGHAEASGLKADRILYVAPAGLGNGISSLGDFPHTKNVPHYAMMARNDIVVGSSQGFDLGDLGHGASALTADGVVRLETGFHKDGSTVESDGGIESHSSVFRRKSTAFTNIVNVIEGGQVELYAPDQLVIAGRTVVTIPGILTEDYEPVMEPVE